MSSKRLIALQGLELLDGAILIGAFGLAAWIEIFAGNAASFTQVMAIRLRLVNVLLMLGILFLWRTVFRVLGLYRSHRLASLRSEAFDVLKATSLSALILLNAAILFRLEIITPRLVGVFWLLSSVTAVTTRVVLRSFLRRVRLAGQNLSRVLIIGSNQRGLRFAERLRSRPELGYMVLGFVDDDWPGIRELERRGEKLVCGLDQLPQYLRENVVDEVVIALPISSAYARSAEIVRVCEAQGIIVRYVTDLFDLHLAQAEVTNFDGQPLISLQTGAIRGGGVLIKRALDFSLALVLLIVMLPALLLVALLIKGSSPGPIFFVQERIGLNKRRFPLYKFRTMVADAEQRLAEVEHLNEVDGPVFKIKHDPRLTLIGRALRKTSLDEVPQLLNVLLGHMSLVGPRPLPVRDYRGFDEDWHRRRFSVRPGITCLWQVSGRSSIPFEKWMELDMKYIDEWSLLLDFQILARTIPAVLRGQGAA